MKVWKSGKLDIKEKGIDDPFTIADTEAQQLIMGILNKKWENLAIVGEEDVGGIKTELDAKLDLVDLKKVPQEYQEVNISDVCVFVDPLDATKEYTVGNLEACMSLIGISLNGKAVAGVMFQPFVKDDIGKTIYGMIGFGVIGLDFFDRPKDKKLIVATTRTHGGEELENHLKTLNPDSILRVGGAGHKAMLVLENRADVYYFPTPGTKKWDTCAPEAILKSMGGTLTDKFGNIYPYFKNSQKPNEYGVIATLPRVEHKKFLLSKIWV